MDAQLFARGEVGHLAHRGAGAELGHAVAVAVHVHPALGDDVEGVTGLTFTVQSRTETVAPPLRAVHHFPQFDVTEAGEEIQAAQQVETLGIEHLLQGAARHFAVGHQRGPILRKLVPTGVAIVARLGHGALQDLVHVLGHTVAQGSQRRWRDIADLVHQRGLR